MLLNPSFLKHAKTGLGILILIVICIVGTSSSFQDFISFPYKLRMFPGEGKELRLTIPIHATVSVEDPEVVSVNGISKRTSNVNLTEPITLLSNHSGYTEMELKLFGKIPFKKWTVDVVPNLQVIPGGQTIGVKVKSKGILVVGYHQIMMEGEKASPGEEAKVELGDLITEINRMPINDVTKVAELVEKAGKAKQSLHLTILRKDKKLALSLKPGFDQTSQAYRLGLYIRDSAAGVGTLTFYAPDHGVYGALGHMITDMDTHTPIQVGGGEIVQSKVTSISKGHQGIPGEKRAHFYQESKRLGSIEHNTQFGIFGKMTEAPEHANIKEAVPVAFSEEVEKGKAQILTVVEGQKVESFDIEITHVSRQTSAATKGMVIKITDPRLLDSTGGIVQGMSGSPIMQKGKIVGAITHVFVNDPTTGYGCFIEWMLQDAGIMLKSSSLSKQDAA